MKTHTQLFLVAFIVVLGFLPKLYANNPIVPYVGMADPHIFIVDGKAYLYATRDADSTANKFTMPDWKIWSSDDLINWTLETTIDPSETYMGKSDNCWATDMAAKDGKYYFYFSNGNVNTGVMKASSPIGPYVDALGKPMLDENLIPGKEYDPTVLTDDDGSTYIAFGHHRDSDPELYFAIAKLSEDMISLAEAPREIKIVGEAKVLSGNDKPTLHKRNGIYYLSAGTHYATSKNVYGPYTKRGNSGNDEYGLSARAHGNYFQWNNQWFHTWCHFHLGKDVARYRESYITYLHYKENGEMVDDVSFLDAHFETGVGQYDAAWDKIEAEWFMAASEINKKENTSGGFEIANINNGDFLYFPNVKNIQKGSSITFNVKPINGGTIEIRSKSENGRVLGSVEIIRKAGCVSDFKLVECELKHTKGVKDIYLTFKGDDQELFSLDWFRFENNTLSENLK